MSGPRRACDTEPVEPERPPRGCSGLQCSRQKEAQARWGPPPPRLAACSAAPPSGGIVAEGGPKCSSLQVTRVSVSLLSTCRICPKDTLLSRRPSAWEQVNSGGSKWYPEHRAKTSLLVCVCPPDLKRGVDRLGRSPHPFQCPWSRQGHWGGHGSGAQANGGEGEGTRSTCGRVRAG